MMRKYHVRFGGGPTEKGSQDHLAGGLPNYAGSGPAQLALALAADVLGDDERAQDVYQRLKFKLVGGLDREGWSLTEAALRSAITTIEQERGRGRSR
jgi:hypothetical protein